MFYRVLCVTLLAIACTFTVILTNVFVDIDLLLARKEKATTEPDAQSQIDHEIEKSINLLAHEKLSKYDYDEEHYREDEEHQLRTKRSLDFQAYKGNLKNPKIKHILTNRLASLLEELDTEVSTLVTPSNVDTEFKDLLHFDDIRRIKIKDVEQVKAEPSKTSEKYLLKLAMHNILLDGIINHIDLNEIYREVHRLGEKFQTEVTTSHNTIKTTAMPITVVYFNQEPKINDEKKIDDDEKSLLDELTKSVYQINQLNLRKEIKPDQVAQKKENFTATLSPNIVFTTSKHNATNSTTKREPKLVITAIIDIVSNPKENLTFNENEIRGDIKIIFNGKPVSQTSTTQTTKVEASQIRDQKLPNTDFTYLHQFLQQYFKMYNQNHKETFRKEKNRTKRHIKLHYNKKDKPAGNPKKYWQKDDDELLVEIKTHFNNKGVHDDRKKKLITTLIGKIEKALHGDLYKTLNQERTENSRMNLRKSLLNNHIDDDNYMEMTLNSRQVDPIANAKDVAVDKPPFWPKKMAAPRTVNSAEIYSDYNEDTGSSTVLQRNLAPISVNEREMLLANTLFELRNKIQSKGLEGGNGYSVRVNEDEPDDESLKMFTFLENFLKKYQSRTMNEDANDLADYDRLKNEYNQNHLVKRDLKMNDYEDIFGTDDYFDDNALITDERDNPEIIQKQVKKRKHNQNDVFDTDILTKLLKPGELMNFATLLDRTKRSSEKRKSLHFHHTYSKKPMKTYYKKTLLNPIKNIRNKRQIRFSDNDGAPDEIFLFSNENGFSQKSDSNDQTKQMESFIKDADSGEVVHPKVQQPGHNRDFFLTSRRNRIIYPRSFFSDFLKDGYTPEEFPKLPVVKETKYSPKNVQMDNDEAPDLQDLLQAIAQGTGTKSNYKLSVKVSPIGKNSSDPMSGFKEIHTSINKTYNHNGINFFSLVNVSEISKIENMKTSPAPNLDHIKNQQETMKSLLTQQKDIINTQLKRLESEKMKIDEIITDATKPNPTSTEKPVKKKKQSITDADELLEGHLPSALSKLMLLNRGEVRQIISAVLEKLQSIPNLKLHLNQIAENEKPKPTTTTTVQPVTAEKPEILIPKLVTRNVVNLTNEILKKIDRNTDMLAEFLSKLSKKTNFNDETKPTTATPSPINDPSEPTESNINVLGYNNYQTHQAAASSRLAAFVAKMNLLHNNFNKRNPGEPLYIKINTLNDTIDPADYLKGKMLVYDYQKPLYIVNKQDISNIVYSRMRSPAQNVGNMPVYSSMKTETSQPRDLNNANKQENINPNVEQKMDYEDKMVGRMQYNPVIYNMTATN